ncbi:MAG: ester cyclase [Steroidobacteraceae bacterium]
MLRTVLAALLLSAMAATPSFAEDVTNNARIVCDGNEQNRDIYLRMWKILFMDRAGERAAEFYAPQVVSHNSDAGGPGRLVSPDDMAKMWEKSKQVDPGRVLDDELVLCAGDYVVVRTTISGTDNAGIGGYPPTGKPYKTTATDIYRFENGKVVERWGNADLVNIFSQLGYTVVPVGLAPPPPRRSAE